MYRLGFMAMVLLQVLCFVHIHRNRRPHYWIWVVLLFPPLGSIAYFVMEVLPDLRRGPSMNRLATSVIELVRPGRALKELEEAVAISDTFANRQQLARGYVEKGRYADAISEYERCLQGTFVDNASALLELAHARFLNSQHPEAQEALARLAAKQPGYRAAERQLLLARSLEESGELEQAVAAYEQMIRSSRGEETRCRYALLLERAGQKERALELYDEILLNVRRSPGYYRRLNREWIKTAKTRSGALSKGRDKSKRA